MAYLGKPYFIFVLVAIFLEVGSARILRKKTSEDNGSAPSLEDRLLRIDDRLDRIEAMLQKNEDIIFIRRQDGQINFYRPWEDYRNGFGDPDGEFWLGLERLHRLTTKRRYKLYVDLMDWSGEWIFAEYLQFYVGSESESYTLRVSGYVQTSTAGDSLIYHNGMLFSTYDKDNDKWSKSCARRDKGGWWYNSCHRANPTGLYHGAGYVQGWDGISWTPDATDYHSYKEVTFKIRPV